MINWLLFLSDSFVPHYCGGGDCRSIRIVLIDWLVCVLIDRIRNLIRSFVHVCVCVLCIEKEITVILTSRCYFFFNYLLILFIDGLVAKMQIHSYIYIYMYMYCITTTSFLLLFFCLNNNINTKTYKHTHKKSKI